MESRSEEREPAPDQAKADEYEAPQVEDVSNEAGPAVTAAGDSPYGAITLIEEDE
jgi:hypothetical protein